MNRVLRTATVLAAIGYLIAMAVTGALPEQRQRVRFEANGVLRVAPGEVVRVELVRGRESMALVRGVDSGWMRSGGAEQALAAPLAEQLSLAVQFMHTSGPVRVLAPDESNDGDKRQFGLDRPVLSIALHTERARALNAHFGGPSPDGLLQYMAAEGRPEVFVMSRFVGGQWLAIAEAVFAER